MNRVKLAVPSHSEQFQWEKIGKAANWVKLAILSHCKPALVGKDWKSCEFSKIGHSEPFQWEKIGKVANQVKLVILTHSEPLQWEKIGKVVNQAKLAILSHYKPALVAKYWKSCKLGEIGHSKSF